MTRHLIVNADDFGQSTGINDGIVEAFERGIVTSTSLMVRGDAVAGAAAYARAHPALSVGVHIDLGEWVHRDGEWELVDPVVDTDDAEAVAREVARQLRSFEHELGRPPTHLDSHQHVHRRQPARRAVVAAGNRLGAPVRHLTSGLTYRGEFYGQTGTGDAYHHAITVDALAALLAGLPEGWTELGCHPGRGVTGSTYGVEREQELAVLCDPRVAAAVVEHGITLRPFHQFGRTELVTTGARHANRGADTT